MRGTRRRRRAAVALGAVLLGAVLPAAASPGVRAAPSIVVGSAEAWWTPLGFRGQAVTTVDTSGGQLRIAAAGTHESSTDGGRHFVSSSAPASTPLPPGTTAEAIAGDQRWAIAGGHVVHASGPSPLLPDPGAPDLGGAAQLIAAPAALRGVVVAVAADGTVWHRDTGGGWSRSLILLPRSLLTGAPRVTSLAAFAAPLSASVYLGTDGYSVLATANGGDDWIRFSPGLPDHVLALATDPAHQAVYAGTADGLWVHHLRALPTVPSYPGPDLVGRWIGTALLSLLGLVAGGALLLVGLRQAARRGVGGPGTAG